MRILVSVPFSPLSPLIVFLKADGQYVSIHVAWLCAQVGSQGFPCNVGSQVPLEGIHHLMAA